LCDKQPVEWITMVQRQTCQRMGMVHRDGQPIERLLCDYLAECDRNLLCQDFSLCEPGTLTLTV